MWKQPFSSPFVGLALSVSWLSLTHAATIVNGTFTDPVANNDTGGGILSLSGLATGVWHFNQGGTAGNFLIADGVAKYGEDDPADTRTRALAQIINDGQTTTGTLTFEFDIQVTNLLLDPESDMALHVLGWNTGDTAPTVDFSQGSGLAFSGVTLNDATSLIGGVFTVFENGANFAPGVDQVAGFDNVSINADFGVSGYDNIAVVYLVSTDQTNSGDLIEIDNVTFVPEPGCLALMGIGGLFMVMRRRRGPSQPST